MNIKTPSLLAMLKAGVYAFRDRRAKKRTFRNLWTIKINAAVRDLGLSYSRLIDMLKKSNIAIDRKILATFAEHSPETFKKILASVQ